uniref:Mei2-like C-terminal RNA recognition motif domain-containing protein n=1 Tax=Aegilops tauschii TaxID=37682 RepID=R7WE68_AEGTA
MAASSTQPLNPAAPPFVPVASALPKLCPPASSSLPVGFPLPPPCLSPRPPLPPPCALSVPPLPWVQVPPPPPCQVTVYCRPLSCPVTAYCIPPPPRPPLLSGKSCSSTETVDGASDKSLMAEEENRPSPRSVLSPRSPASVSPRAPKPRAAPRPMGSKPAFDPSTGKTSLMICNIPNGFSKRRIMAILDQHCAEENEKLRRGVDGGGKAVNSEYDFLYVPIDFRTKYNKGYAFVNMTTATAARRLHAFLHGHSWAATGSKKVCEVVHASIQGADALVKHFSGSKFPCGNGNEEFLPVRFGPPRSDRRPTAERVIGQAVVRSSPPLRR